MVDRLATPAIRQNTLDELISNTARRKRQELVEKRGFESQMLRSSEERDETTQRGHAVAWGCGISWRGLDGRGGIRLSRFGGQGRGGRWRGVAPGSGGFDKPITHIPMWNAAAIRSHTVKFRADRISRSVSGRLRRRLNGDGDGIRGYTADGYCHRHRIPSCGCGGHLGVDLVQADKAGREAGELHVLG